MGDWRKMLADVNRLKLKEISVFLTGAIITERKKIYQTLDKSTVKFIPHVHARHDMAEWEFDYFIKNFGTKAFTLHFQYLKYLKNSKHLEKIFIENNIASHKIKNLKPLKKVGGLCIDLSHYIELKHHNQELHDMTVAARKLYKVGCNHLSAVLPNKRSVHKVSKLSDLDYVADIPQKYFSKYICLELMDSIPEQLKFKQYIAKTLAQN
jgi:hypothetical protein